MMTISVNQLRLRFIPWEALLKIPMKGSAWPVRDTVKIRTEEHFLISHCYFKYKKETKQKSIKDFPITLNLIIEQTYIWLLSNEKKNSGKTIAKYTSTCLAHRKNSIKHLPTPNPNPVSWMTPTTVLTISCFKFCLLTAYQLIWC